MLIARASKRDASARFKRDARVDLILDGEAIGGLVYAIGPETAEITLRGAAYRMARERARKDEALFGMAVRVVRGQEKPGPNPIRLTDTAGRILASAEEAPRGAAISFGGERFAFRRRSAFSPRYDLYAENREQPLGSVGQRSLCLRVTDRRIFAGSFRVAAGVSHCASLRHDLRRARSIEFMTRQSQTQAPLFGA